MYFLGIPLIEALVVAEMQRADLLLLFYVERIVGVTPYFRHDSAGGQLSSTCTRS